MFSFIKSKKILILSFLFLAGLLLTSMSVKADWSDPTSTPPLYNQSRPINVGSLAQEKTGALILSNSTAGLILRDQSPLLFGKVTGKRFGFKSAGSFDGLCVGGSNAMNNCTSNANCPGGSCDLGDTVWSLPLVDGSSGQVLTTNGSRSLSWTTPSGSPTTLDDDWRYDPNSTSFTSIYSERLTRIGSGGTRNYATSDGDLYVQDALEVDGQTYANQITATGLNLSFPSGSILFHSASGLAYDNANFFWDNTSKHLGIGTNTPSDFSLQVAGHVGPNANNTYDLGSSTKNWRNIYAQNMIISGFTQGSVIFQGASALSQNNGNFFWDNTNKRLGLGINTPSQTLDIKGNAKLSATNLSGTEGVLYLGGMRFMHSAGESWWAEPNSSFSLLHSNTYLGGMAGSFSDSSNEEFAYENVGVGFYSLSANLSGELNTAVGSNSLYSNISGDYNTAIGARSLRNTSGASNNTAVGFNALLTASSGNKLTAVGSNAGYNNTTGSDNAFFGYQAGNNNTTGSKNVYIGSLSGNTNQAGTENIYIGDRSGYTNSNGNGNIMLGSGAGTNNVSGSGNIFLGTKAGYNETGTYKLYIESSQADSNSALITGQFYSASAPETFLRFNGNVGIAPRGTTGFSFSKLLHLYQVAGINAEMDIQSVANDGAGNAQQRQWSIYHDRSTKQLRFWNAFAGGASSYDVNNAYNNLLTLADNGKVGIGVRSSDAPEARLEIHGQGNSSSNELLLSNYSFDQTTGGENIISFMAARNNSVYGKWLSAQLVSGFSGSNSDVYNNAVFKLRLPAPSTGGLSDKAVFNNTRFTFSPSDRSVFESKVNVNGVHSDSPNVYTLAVTGSIHGDDYYSTSNLRGNTEYVCVARSTALGVVNYLMRFENGLYICTCAASPSTGCGGCTCTN